MENTPMIITSRQNQYVSLAAGLMQRKQRRSEQMFRFDGVKLFCEAQKRGVDMEFVLVDASQQNSVDHKARELYGFGLDAISCRVLLVSHDIFEKISDENAPEGIICVAKYIDKFHKIATIDNNTTLLEQLAGPQQGRVLLCESLRDPGNVGAVVRTAYAFGIDWLILSEDCADLYNPKTVRGAMGALFRQRICVVDDLPAAISVLREHGRRVLAATLDDTSVSIADVNVSRRDCLVVGNEGHGLSAETVRACAGSIIIPMQEGSESLNAGVAASVLMWEQYRGEQK